MSEPTTMQEMVDGQLAELQITTAEVTGETYKERHAAKIAALAEEEAALPTPTDKASLQVVQDFITKSEKARTGIDKFRKAFKDRWKPMLDAVDAYLGTTKESGRQAEIYAIQQRAEAKKKAYLDEQAKAAREAERLLEERYRGRVAKLLEAGMVIEANGNLTIQEGGEGGSLMPSQIRFFTDEQMANAIERASALQQRRNERLLAEQQAKEAQEREEAEERERLRVQKEEQDAKESKLKEEREALEKEREEMADARAETRGADLVVLGAVSHGYGPAIRYEIGDVIVGHGELRHMDAETWTATRDRVRNAKVKAIEEKRERDRQLKLQDEREYQLSDLGASNTGTGVWVLGLAGTSERIMKEASSDEWDAVLARFKEAAENAKQNAESVKPEHGDPALWSDGPDNMWPLVRKPLEDERFPKCEQPLQEGGAVVDAQPADEFSGEPLTVESAIFQALGEASMCWDPRPTGIFDSTRCKDVGERLLETLKKLEAINFGE